MEFGKGIQADRMKNTSPLIRPSLLMLTKNLQHLFSLPPGFLDMEPCFLIGGKKKNPAGLKPKALHTDVTSV